jgi:hypothetical protein
LRSFPLKARSCSSGFPFDPFKKADIIIVQEMKRKISSSYSRQGKGWGKDLDILLIEQVFGGGVEQLTLSSKPEDRLVNTGPNRYTFSTRLSVVLYTWCAC